MHVHGDSVDRLLQDWARERPDLDFAPVAIVTRLARLRRHLDAGLQHVFDRYDLTAADFTVIVSLRRAGAPYCRAQAELMAQLGLTSGTMSVRIDRLVSRGVVVRQDHPDDRRVQLIRLTDEGLRLFDEIAPAHLANEDRLLSALTATDREQLAGLLRLLLEFIRGRRRDRGRRAGRRGLPRARRAGPAGGGRTLRSGRAAGGRAARTRHPRRRGRPAAGRSHHRRQ